MHNRLKPRWLVEMIAVWGYVQRNYFLTKRYFMWEVVWLTFTTVNAMSITFIGAGVDQVGGGKGTIDVPYLMTFLLVGALIWSYLSMIFDVLSETVQWERWEGTIEYTFMSPSSRVTHLSAWFSPGLRHRPQSSLASPCWAFDSTSRMPILPPVVSPCPAPLVGFGY